MATAPLHKFISVATLVYKKIQTRKFWRRNAYRKITQYLLNKKYLLSYGLVKRDIMGSWVMEEREIKFSVKNNFKNNFTDFASQVFYVFRNRQRKILTIRQNVKKITLRYTYTEILNFS